MGTFEKWGLAATNGRLIISRETSTTLYLWISCVLIRWLLEIRWKPFH